MSLERLEYSSQKVTQIHTRLKHFLPPSSPLTTKVTVRGRMKVTVPCGPYIVCNCDRHQNNGGHSKPTNHNRTKERKKEKRMPVSTTPQNQKVLLCWMC